ncbi:hypothetical protein [Gallaecimonas sp. GXIMD4217]|uniref:hypothetical protein n=1 Tax=Gallaecimonas sp. GXIMD4217 TaxID=3131927 RepID=UPI00311B257E
MSSASPLVCPHCGAHIPMGECLCHGCQASIRYRQGLMHRPWSLALLFLLVWQALRALLALGLPSLTLPSLLAAPDWPALVLSLLLGAGLSWGLGSAIKKRTPVEVRFHRRLA